VTARITVAAPNFSVHQTVILPGSRVEVRHVRELRLFRVHSGIEKRDPYVVSGAPPPSVGDLMVLII
jgi:hypothetical protein